MKNFDDAVTVITGAGSGIGQAMARNLASKGAVIAALDIDKQRADDTAASITTAGGRCTPFQVDVTDPAAVADAAQQVQSDLGPVRLLCNNAGVLTSRVHIWETTPAHWAPELSINLHGEVNTLLAFLPGMVALDGERHIVNTSSLAGVVATPQIAPYTTSKFGVVGLSEALALEVRDLGIGVSVLCPGPVDTFLGGTPPRGADAAPAGVAQPDQVAKLVVHAIEHDWRYIFPHGAYHRDAITTWTDTMFGAMDDAERWLTDNGLKLR